MIGLLLNLIDGGIVFCCELMEGNLFLGKLINK